MRLPNWTALQSGCKEDLQELLQPSNFQQSVAAPAEQQGLPMKFVLLNRGYENAVEKDAAAIYGLNTPQNYHSLAGAPKEIPLRQQAARVPHRRTEHLQQQSLCQRDHQALREGHPPSH